MEVEFWANDEEEDDLRTRGGVLDGVPRLVSFKYTSTIFLPAKLDEASLHLSTAKTVQRFESLCLGPVMECLSGRSDEIGMKINAGKTQLMVISPSNGCNTSAIIESAGVTPSYREPRQTRVSGTSGSPADRSKRWDSGTGG